MQHIFSIKNETEFSEICLSTFRRQAVECEPYARYLSLLGVEVAEVDEVKKIPFLPIEFFKTEKIICGNAAP
ncbi:MAG: acyltransferase, partial [Prevotellaceae bacterium]|nr:acyltransferase [Prevotellaceae bacterium]